MNQDWCPAAEVRHEVSRALFARVAQIVADGSDRGREHRWLHSATSVIVAMSAANLRILKHTIQSYAYDSARRTNCPRP